MPLTRVILRLKSVPEPESGVKSFEKADILRVMIDPFAEMILPDTFQFVAVSPAGETGVAWNVTIVESKVKSPWNAIRLFAPLIVVVTTG